MRWLPIALVVVGNVAYHLGQKSVPRAAHPLAATLGMYLVATVATLLVMALAMPLAQGGIARADLLPPVHWSVLLAGLGIVGIEVGFLVAYRLGWPISSAALVATTILALVLLPIGVTQFREAITATRGAGFGLCLIGLWLLQRS